MTIKLGNNASARLAGALNIFSTSIALNASEISGFPTLGDGEWFPMTLTDPSGNMEIVKVTARNANIFTAVRAQEGTTARDFTASARAEIRITVKVIQTLQDDTAALAVAVDAKDAAVLAGAASSAASMDALLAASLLASMDSKDTALHATVTSEIATAKTQAQAYSDAALAAAVTALAEPAGTIKMWLPTTAPSGWQFCYGQALSRTTNAALFAAIGTTYGAGDGSTTFNVPDLRGTAVVGKDNMGGAAAGRVTTAGSGVDGATLGARGGVQAHTLAATELPAHAHTASTSVVAASAGTPAGTIGAAGTHNHNLAAYGTSNGSPTTYTQLNINTGTKGPTAILTDTEPDHAHAFTGSAMAAHAHTASTTVNNSTGGGGAHNNMQPSLVVNFIIRT